MRPVQKSESAFRAEKSAHFLSLMNRPGKLPAFGRMRIERFLKFVLVQAATETTGEKRHDYVLSCHLYSFIF
jgi:hypothetical protein